MLRLPLALSATVILTVLGCTSVPDGPSVMVLPGTGLSFDRFRGDDAVCRQYASAQIGNMSTNQIGVNSGLGSAIIGTGLGAATGAAFGGGSGAAIGAGGGLMAGSVVGSGMVSDSMYEAQQRYDVAYIQCMYAKGHQVPVSGQFTGTQSSQSPATSSAPIPPPPPGTPPPPPQR